MKTLKIILFAIFIGFSSFAQVQKDSTVTAIDPELISSIKVYPNPFSTSINIEFDRKLEYVVIDQLGNNVRDLQSAKSGIYFIVFVEKKGKYIVKVAKI